ncbi:DUF262 domain-containing protein [Burkholderia sp. Bp9012]|uniref:GmrSD restriction endonuclease domain-containing protein n=1 Tax=Burkholderia sp. Bp9012 TaxID=2184562 RepID=UPI001628D723|nr:DUF262 domain-containing protein [Burkholderia sp. Bp9012]
MAASATLPIENDLLLVEGGQTTSVEEENAGAGVPHVPFDPEKLDVKTKPLTLDSLVKRLTHNEIELSPDFQRRAHLWTNERKSRLIESILLRIPLPVFYFAAKDADHWLVVDGLQRLSSIQQFVLNKSDPLVLSGLEYLTDLEGKKWSDLPRSYVRRFEEYEITVHIIQPVHDKTVMTSIFRRINTGGLPLSDQEIRHALFQGPGSEWLGRIVEHPMFKASTEGKIDDSRMEARECILRYLAFYTYGWENYSLSREDAGYNTLGSFLDRAMERLNLASDQDRDKWEDDFIRASTAAKNILGRYAFRKVYATDSGIRRGPINKALYEAWMVSLTDLTEKQIQRLVTSKGRVLETFERVLHAQSTEENRSSGSGAPVTLMSAISATTGDTARVHCRHRVIREILKECLDN